MSPGTLADGLVDVPSAPRPGSPAHTGEPSTGWVYRAIWEIRDDERPMSALVAEASAALDAMAAASGARITGDPEWTFSGDRLVCVAPAEPVDTEALTARERRERRDREVERLAGLGWSDRQIAATLGVAPSTVRAIRIRLAASSPTPTKGGMA